VTAAQLFECQQAERGHQPMRVDFPLDRKISAIKMQVSKLNSGFMLKERER